MGGSITMTVFYEGPFWVAVLERESAAGYSVSRHIFGGEPTDPEVYEFILHGYDSVRFSRPSEEKEEVIKKKNPKRLQREARKEMEKGPNMSKAYESIRIETEKNKKERKAKGREQREEEERVKFEKKQLKKKQKLKGR